MSPQPQSFQLRFIQKKEIAKDTYAFFFDTTNHPIHFLPGQYIRIVLPSVKQFNSRFFTIASSPLQSSSLMIALKKGKSEFNNALFALEPNSLVEFFGPNGGLYLDETDYTPKVFLAGGIGIVSFYSMMQDIVEKKLPTEVSLFASFSKREDMIFYDHLMDIAKNNTNIKIIYTLTQESTDVWSGEKGRISENLLTKYIPDITKPTFYIVGFPEMVNDTEEILETMKICLSRIKTEAFIGY